MLEQLSGFDAGGPVAMSPSVFPASHGSSSSSAPPFSTQTILGPGACR